MKISKFLRIIVLLLVLLTTHLYTFAMEEPTVKEGDVLSLDECVSVAINNSPLIKAKAYYLQIASSNVGIAKSAYFPTLGYNTMIYQDYNTNKEYNGANNRELPQVNVYLNQLLWNFGKSNSLIRMERFYKIAAEYEFLDSICNTIYDVKMKYYALLKAKSILIIAENNLLINEHNLDRCKKLYARDKKYKIDYTNAKIYVADAEMKLEDARNDYNIALADLGNSMYIAPAPNFSIKNVDTFNFTDIYMPSTVYSERNIKNNNLVDISLKTKIEKNTGSKIKKLPYTMNESFSIAEKNSPDLWVLDATLSAMKQALLAVKRQYLPELSGNVGYGLNNTQDFGNSSLIMYLNLSSNVNVKQLKHEIDRAQAEVNLAANDIDMFRQNLYFEVKKAFFNVYRAEKQLKISEQKVIYSKENFELVDAAYNEGKNDYIAYLKAREDYNDSKIEYAQMLYEYNISLANLEIAMHTHVDNLHEHAEHAMEFHYKDLLNKLDASLKCHEHKHEHIEDK